MHIESLKLYHFRNLKDQTVHFNAGANFIVGKNGQGKTNLVEAINLLSIGRSFRTTGLDELIRWKEKSCSVFATVNTSSGRIDLGVAIEGESRKAYLDGEQVEFVGAFLGKLLCISFSPTDIALVKGSPQERRKFLDKHMVDLEPQLMTALVDYHKALRNKNALLKAGVSDARALDTWNELLAAAALKIHLGRAQFLADLQDRAAKIYAKFSADDGAVTLGLKSSAFASETPVTIEGLLERYAQVRDREIHFRASAIGPHRDEVQIDLAGNPARAFASQGQSRSIVLSLKLAVLELLEQRRNERPVILLDDVESELDAARRAALVALIYERECQTFITGTEQHQGNLSSSQKALELIISGGEIESKNQG
ncbi:MAG: DNA replication/repair protein RecF [Deltaproteobacteria bacterium]|nr:DNA replication/repair protein RecF [Deltaproteobacteria bacterium]